ncbi:MAG TPA: hypothetical protein PKC45_01110, partial [Gemmatales bacterium]|nr:hypothetical protein [Gemmatales bacterium]
MNARVRTSMVVALVAVSLSGCSAFSKKSCGSGGCGAPPPGAFGPPPAVYGSPPPAAGPYGQPYTPPTLPPGQGALQPVPDQ